MQSPTNTVSVFFYCTILLVCLSHQSDARDTITTSTPLRDDANETLVSAGGIFELGFFTAGGNNKYVGIWYHNLSRRVVWVANREAPVTDSSGSFAIADGNLKVLSNVNATPITDLKNASVNRTVKLMYNGNLIVSDGRPSPLWQSFEHPTDTFLPRMKMNDAIVLKSWSSTTDPAPGDYTFRKDQELYKIQNGSNIYWKSGEPGISIIKNKVPYAYLSGFTEGLDESKYQSSQDNSTISFNFTRPSNYIVSGLVMNSTGKIQYYRWSDGEGWTFLWSEPQDPCSVYNACGKFSICDSNRDPQCNCLPGFQPVSKVDSNFGDDFGDCQKRKPRCDDTTDKMNQSTFLNLSLTNFRASESFQNFDEAGDKEECEKECLKNCKCKAYYMSDASATRTRTSGVVPVCFIGTGDLENLCRVEGESRVQLNVLVDMDLKARDCKPCGDVMIPYPLSTRPNCGDPLYSSFDCDNSTGIFYFQTLSGHYRVISINKENRTFVIEVNSETANSCDARNFSRQIAKLNQSTPFTVTNWCYKRRIEISWKPPLEPSCNVSGDCRDWPNSSCHARANGMSKCYCDQKYQWDGTSLNCVQGRTFARWLKYVIIIIAVFAAVLLVCCFCYNLYRRKRMTRRQGSDENRGENPVLWSYERSDRQVSDLMDEENKSGVGVPFCSWESILAATENFSDVHKLGRGGFGPVTRECFLEDKRLQ